MPLPLTDTDHPVRGDSPVVDLAFGYAIFEGTDERGPIDDTAFDYVDYLDALDDVVDQLRSWRDGQALDDCGPIDEEDLFARIVSDDADHRDTGTPSVWHIVRLAGDAWTVSPE
jgi:hypothetical protein